MLQYRGSKPLHGCAGWVTARYGQPTPPAAKDSKALRKQRKAERQRRQWR
jgi:hypothetical protein